MQLSNMFCSFLTFHYHKQSLLLTQWFSHSPRRRTWFFFKIWIFLAMFHNNEMQRISEGKILSKSWISAASFSTKDKVVNLNQCNDVAQKRCFSFWWIVAKQLRSLLTDKLLIVFVFFLEEFDIFHLRGCISIKLPIQVTIRILIYFVFCWWPVCHNLKPPHTA